MIALIQGFIQKLYKKYINMKVNIKIFIIFAMSFRMLKALRVITLRRDTYILKAFSGRFGFDILALIFQNPLFFTTFFRRSTFSSLAFARTLPINRRNYSVSAKKRTSFFVLLSTFRRSVYRFRSLRRKNFVRILGFSLYKGSLED